MKTLFDEPEQQTGPVLLPVQLDLLERGRVPYTQGARRVIWQAPCAAGKTWVAAEQTVRALKRNQTVLHIVHLRRLVDQMLGTLHKFGVYAAPIMEGRATWDAKVYCASRDTLLAMLNNGCDLPRVSLVVIDECHVESGGIVPWYLKNTPDVYLTGYTATPVRSDGRSMNPPYQALVCMAPNSKMIELGRTVPIKIYNPDEVGRRRLRGGEAKPIGDPIEHWKKYAFNLPTVVFASRISDSLEIVARYRNAGITAEHIDGTTPEKERDDVFARSERGETKIISNVGVLIAGVDLPWLTCCQLLRGCESLVLWHQAMGRISRASPGKECGIGLDHAGAAHSFGCPSDDYTWVLGDAKAITRANPLSKERQPITCPRCGLVFSNKPKCPECGKVLPKRKRAAMGFFDGSDGLLTEFVSGQEDDIKHDRLLRLYKKCYFVTKNRGGSMGMVNAMFRTTAKINLWEAGLDVQLPRGSEWKLPANDWQLV